VLNRDISSGVTKPVVNGFQMVDINRQQRAWCIVATPPPNLILQRFSEPPSIREPGQRIEISICLQTINFKLQRDQLLQPLSQQIQFTWKFEVVKRPCLERCSTSFQS